MRPQRSGERQIGVRGVGLVNLELVDRIRDASGGRGQVDQGFGCAPVGAD